LLRPAGRNLFCGWGKPGFLEGIGAKIPRRYTCRILRTEINTQIPSKRPLCPQIEGFPPFPWRIDPENGRQLIGSMPKKIRQKTA
jgi:hypothetical protein